MVPEAGHSPRPLMARLTAPVPAPALAVGVRATRSDSRLGCWMPSAVGRTSEHDGAGRSRVRPRALGHPRGCRRRRTRRGRWRWDEGGDGDRAQEASRGRAAPALDGGFGSRDDDRAAACAGHSERGLCQRRPSPRCGGAFGLDAHAVSRKRGDDRPIPIRPEDPRAGCREPRKGRRGRMTVRIAGPGGRDGHGRPDRFDKWLGGRRAATVMSHLQEVHVGQPVGQERRIDPLLDVAHEQEPARADLAEQDDRHVVDTGAAIGWFDRHLASDGPEHSQRDLVDCEPIAGGDGKP